MRPRPCYRHHFCLSHLHLQWLTRNAVSARSYPEAAAQANEYEFEKDAGEGGGGDADDDTEGAGEVGPCRNCSTRHSMPSYSKTRGYHVSVEDDVTLHWARMVSHR